MNLNNPVVMTSRILTVRVSFDETGLWSETSRLALE